VDLLPKRNISIVVLSALAIALAVISLFKRFLPGLAMAFVIGITTSYLIFKAYKLKRSALHIVLMSFFIFAGYELFFITWQR